MLNYLIVDVSVSICVLLFYNLHIFYDFSSEMEADHNEAPASHKKLTSKCEIEKERELKICTKRALTIMVLVSSFESAKHIWDDISSNSLSRTELQLQKWQERYLHRKILAPLTMKNIF